LSSVQEFVAARDFLLSAKNYEEAKAGFNWQTPDNFNWALNYFDQLVDKCTNPALEYVDDRGCEKKVSFQVMKERSSKVANMLQTLELQKGDRVLVMLPNRVELFETILGAMKVGCVIIPASTMLTSDDVKDRMTRGQVRCVIADEQMVPTIENAIPKGKEIVKINLGGELKGWVPFSEIDSEPAHLLHLGHNRQTETRPSYIRQLPDRASEYNVLDWHQTGRRSLQHQRSRVGEACVEQYLRSLECRSNQLRVQLHGKIQPERSSPNGRGA
jgi:hypothetical protein